MFRGKDNKVYFNRHVRDMKDKVNHSISHPMPAAGNESETDLNGQAGDVSEEQASPIHHTEIHGDGKVVAHHHDGTMEETQHEDVHAAHEHSKMLHGVGEPDMDDASGHEMDEDGNDMDYSSMKHAF